MTCKLLIAFSHDGKLACCHSKKVLLCMWFVAQMEVESVLLTPELSWKVPFSTWVVLHAAVFVFFISTKDVCLNLTRFDLWNCKMCCTKSCCKGVEHKSSACVFHAIWPQFVLQFVHICYKLQMLTAARKLTTEQLYTNRVCQCDLILFFFLSLYVHD